MAEPATLRHAAADGLRGLRRTARMIFPLYLANLLVALFAVLPLYAGLHRLTAWRPAAGALLTRWDLEIIAELLTDQPALVAELKAVLLFVPIAYLLLSQLLLGGVLGAVQRGDRPTARAFGGDALGQLWPLCRLLVWAGLPFAVTGAVLGFGFVLAEEEAWPWRVAALLPGLGLFVWTDAALDFARARRFLGGEGSALRWLLTGFGVVLRRPLSALGLHLGFGLLGWLPLLSLYLVPDTIDAGGTAAVLLAFLLGQAMILSRVAVRVAGLGAHLALLAALQRGARPAQLPTPAVPATSASSPVAPPA